MNYEPIFDYLCSLPTCSYFQFLACRFRDLIISLDKEVFSENFQHLLNYHEEILDNVMYLQDILGLKIEKINYMLTNSLFYYTIIPLLCGTLVCKKTPKIMINTSLYILLLLVYYINDERFLNLLFSLLFSEKISLEISKYLDEYPSPPLNYFFKWENEKKVNSKTSFASCKLL